jgi:hypothetical protein
MKKSVSKVYLKEARNTVGRVKSPDYLRELVERKKRVTDNSEISVFVSYDSGDEETMLSVLLLLDSAGVKICPVLSGSLGASGRGSDKDDSVRNNIARCSKLVFIASDNAMRSPRCNWELGIGDGLMTPANTAIMPVTEQRGATWSCPDHLLSYPMLVTDNDFFIGEFFIESMDRKISLTEWLRQR